MTRLAIEKSTITLVALAVVLIGGISAYNTLPRAQDPGFIIRTAIVQTVFPGASPERVELLVTDTGADAGFVRQVQQANVEVIQA